MNPQPKHTEHATPRRKRSPKIIEFPNVPVRINVAELLERWKAREAKRKTPRYVPTSNAARAKSVFVHSYIVGEHWRRRPSSK